MKANPVWGSSVYRILLEVDHNRIKSDFSGTMTLFERRHEADKVKFNSLEEFISKLREFWDKSLSTPAQDTRIARWLVEYLQELNINTDYNEVLSILKGNFKVEPDVVVEEENELQEEEITFLLEEKSNIKIKAKRKKIQMSELSQDKLNQVLDSMLSDVKPTRKTTGKTIIGFTTPDGKEEKIEAEKPILEAPIDDVVNYKSGFKNSFDYQITNLSLSDIIPFDYEINDVKLSGIVAEKINEEPTDDGLKIDWNVPTLNPNEDVEIEYVLGKRILRTILIHDEDEVTTLQTYEGILKEGSYYYAESTYVFQSKTDVIDNVRILDQVPNDFQVVTTHPDAKEPLGRINRESVETEIIWSFSNIRVNSQHVTNYELKLNKKMLREIIEIIDENEDHVGIAIRVLKPLIKTEGIASIMAIKLNRSIKSNITLIDTLSGVDDVKIIQNEHGSVSVVNEINSNKVLWVLENISPDETFYAFLKYEGVNEPKFKLELLVHDKIPKTFGVEEITTKKDKIILPPEYYYLIDV